MAIDSIMSLSLNQYKVSIILKNHLFQWFFYGMWNEYPNDYHIAGCQNSTSEIYKNDNQKHTEDDSNSKTINLHKGSWKSRWFVFVRWKK